MKGTCFSVLDVVVPTIWTDKVFFWMRNWKIGSVKNACSF
jgi:hypothetical protein